MRAPRALPLRIIANSWLGQDTRIPASEASMNSSRCDRLLRTVAVIGVIIIGASLAAQQPPAASAPGAAARPTPLRSPDIHLDRTVTFRLLAPKAAEVTLNGSWDSGTNLKMTRDDAGGLSPPIGPL